MASSTSPEDKNVSLGRGLFFAFEGLDGSGKSTQLAFLAARMRALGFPVETTREPTGSLFGALIHNIMTHRIVTNDITVAAMFVADRVDHLLNTSNGILMQVNAGVSVLSDRYYFSSYAYNGSRVSMEWVIKANEVCTRILRPDLNIFLDVPPEMCADRMEARRRLELYEKRQELETCRQKYFEAFKLFDGVEKIVIIPGTGRQEEVHERVWNAVNPIILRHIGPREA